MLRIVVLAVLTCSATLPHHEHRQQPSSVNESSGPQPPSTSHTVTTHKRWWSDEIKNVKFTFDCTNKAVGFYADVEYDCQIFHMCDEEGHRVPHLCANDTSFNQEYRICDWDYNFNCAEAPKWYYLNELTYATDPPPDYEELQE